MIEGLKMEEKESNDSGSPVFISDNGSPPVSGGYSSGGGVGMVQPAAAANVSIGGAPGGGGGGVGTEVGTGVVVARSGIDSSGKRKRGRPRKYDENGNLTPSYMKSPPPPPSNGVLPPPPGFYLTPPANASGKRGRGRPPGSGNWQSLAPWGELASTAAADFTPHLVPVNVGEDVAAKVYSLALSGPRGVCVISANGAISNVTLRQPCASGGTLTYEGRFELLSLTGSYVVSEKNGIITRTGSLSVALAGPDGRVIGGGIAGLLKAAGPIQMVVGSFIPDGYKPPKKKYYYQPRTSPLVHSAPVPALPALPISQAAPNGNLFPTPTPPQLHVQSHGEAANKTGYKDNTISASIVTSGWNGADPAMQRRPSPDINVSVPME